MIGGICGFSDSFFFFKQKTAYEMRISDWSSDVCSSDLLAQRSIRRVGLGSVNGRYFLFHVGMGFDAAVVAQVERRAGLKRYAGHPLFVYSGFDTWIRHYDRTRPRFALRFADGSVVDDGYLSICLNTDRKRVGGGKRGAG